MITKLVPLSQPIRIQTKTNRVLAARVFPALGANCMYLLRILIGSLCCLHLLRLARVIILVLVLLTDSIGNRSIRRVLSNSKGICARVMTMWEKQILESVIGIHEEN